MRHLATTIAALAFALPASAVTLIADNGDIFAINAGDTFDNVILFETAHIDMTGGDVTGHFLMLDSSTSTFTGGTVGSLDVFNQAKATVVIQSGTLDIDGFPEPEPKLLTDADCSACTVSATLANGDPVGPTPFSALQSGEIEVVAVPEPTTALLMGFGLLGLAYVGKRH